MNQGAVIASQPLFYAFAFTRVSRALSAAAYVELRTCLDPKDEHWIRLAEVEPVVPPYKPGESFDGWIVLPVLATRTAYSLHGSGFAPRTRLQIRASAYFVS